MQKHQDKNTDKGEFFRLGVKLSFSYIHKPEWMEWKLKLD